MTLEYAGRTLIPFILNWDAGEQKANVSRINMSITNTLPSNAASLAPIVNWADYNHAAHVVQFYGEDGFLLDELSRFIGTALGSGEAAVVIATKEHRDGLTSRLQAWGRHFDPAIVRTSDFGSEGQRPRNGAGKARSFSRDGSRCRGGTYEYAGEGTGTGRKDSA
jgi:hypothetical protein